ncbi:putative rhamnulose-1-phosphate aldolase [Acidisarcina polymorpha]|uniref:Putative rhamnulose-1-phosphate aldolase n=1 Tax=Acidisarcina polymorpha TaxID=2211140 RepID=A0A2Z5G5Q0_9BACT|nr:bifunctional rhamnulose-1-phosphate aldolase/short-chain dehydrogenase [Acidisarcina polymorpha]AXC14421.1 putative rhamnulose-1-phosphate aldolase [Acidisarcina polymorpha]
MASVTETQTTLHYLKDLWDDALAATLDQAELLRYRSNLLGSDLRITNFAGGNTSSKILEIDPLTGEKREVLWVKGSGGDLGSMKRGGLATLYLEKLHALEQLYRGVDFEDEMVDMYPLCTFKNNPVAASIDTPLHGFLPFPHVDHLHPDWGIALAASANGLEKMAEFNQRYGHHLVWVPWQRPGFELGIMMKRTIEANPACDGIVLGGHGLFTWGNTHRESYLNTITIIDQLGQFVNEHIARRGDAIFGGVRYQSREDRTKLAMELFPYLRGQVSSNRRVIGSYSDLPEVLRFANSKDGEALAYLGTSCPDHFIRTKIRPLYVKWDPSGDLAGLKSAIADGLKTYRKEYAEYYKTHAEPDSPAMRDDNPSIVVIPGLGMFSFGKSKTESRITGEFYTNAIHVMEGASAMAEGVAPKELPQAGPAAPTSAFKVHTNYVALPALEAFRIEYWKLEEAKIRRQPAEKQLSRQIAVIIGGGSGIGREVALLAAERGAHVVVADRDLTGAEAVAAETKAVAGKEHVTSVSVDIRSRETIREAIAKAVQAFGGVDILINTAAIFPASPDGIITDAQWALTLEVNVTANYLLADEATKLFRDQGLPVSVVLTSSANAVVPKRGSEAYDVSKAALSHLVRELAVGLAPLVRVNGISPATVVKGSTMFPRDRVVASLTKYSIPFESTASDDELRNQLAGYYAKRTLTHQPIDPKDCAEAILFLAGPAARCTTGHLIPVDGGLTEAFLR